MDEELQGFAGKLSVASLVFVPSCSCSSTDIYGLCMLQEFKAEHGHTNVPQEYSKNPALGNWVKYNRLKMREWDNNGSDDEVEKMTLLIEIGMRCYIGKWCCYYGTSVTHMHMLALLLLTLLYMLYACLMFDNTTGKGNAARVNGIRFSPQQIQAWEKQFIDLCKYKEENGDCDIPTNETGKWKSLGEWVKRQRKVYRYRKFHSDQSQGGQGSKYLIDRFDRLNKVGFKFRIGSGKGKK